MFKKSLRFVLIAGMLLMLTFAVVACGRNGGAQTQQTSSGNQSTTNNGNQSTTSGSNQTTTGNENQTTNTNNGSDDQEIEDLIKSANDSYKDANDASNKGEDEMIP